MTEAPGTSATTSAPAEPTLDSVTLAVSAEGAAQAPSQSAPLPSLEEGEPSYAQLIEYSEIAAGKRPLPGEEPIAPTTSYSPPPVAAPPVSTQAAPAPPAPAAQSEFAQLLATVQAQQQQMAQMLENLQRAPQQQQAPQIDEAAQRIAMMQQAKLNPANPDDQFKFDMWLLNQQQAAEIAELKQFVGGIQQRAQYLTVEQQVARDVDANISALKSTLPPEVRADIIERAAELAQRGDKNAVERALRPYTALIKSLQPPAVAPPPSIQPNAAQYANVPGFAGMTPEQQAAALQSMSAVSVPGKGAGRHQRPATLEEVTRLVSRH